MALEENEIVGQLKDAGARLLQPPSSREELLQLLEELELILLKVEQSPSKTIQEALLPSLKALISDHVIKNSDSDIKITVAVCCNEIMRITAPDSPYDDRRMKEIFELIVASFDKLSLLSGNSYSKAVSIIENVAKVRCCVMMLDLECDKLIIEMFEQFKKNLRSDHPHSVFLAMEEIMSLIIDESEDIPLDLLKVLLDCVRKEKETTSPMSWRLGAKVIERTSQKLKPYLRDATKSGDIRKDDYAPLVDSMLKIDSEIMEQNHVADLAEQVVDKEPAVDASSSRDNGKLAVAAGKPVSSLDAESADQYGAANQKSKSSAHFKQSEAPDSADVNTETEKENGRSFPNEGHEAPSKSLKSPQGCPKKSSVIAVKNDSPSVEIAPRKEFEMLTNSEEKNCQQASVKPNHSGKKLGRPGKDGAGGSGNQRSSSKLGMCSPKKENGMDDTKKRVLRRKRNQMEEEVFETPFGKKKYKEDIVGSRIKVWWPQDKMYYEGCITSYNSLTKKHRVDYDDGDVENLIIVNEKFEFIGDEIANNNVASFVNLRKMDIKPRLSSDERTKQDDSAKKSRTAKTDPEDSNAN